MKGFFTAQYEVVRFGWEGKGKAKGHSQDIFIFAFEARVVPPSKGPGCGWWCSPLHRLTAGPHRDVCSCTRYSGSHQCHQGKERNWSKVMESKPQMPVERDMYQCPHGCRRGVSWGQIGRGEVAA